MIDSFQLFPKKSDSLDYGLWDSLSYHAYSFHKDSEYWKQKTRENGGQRGQGLGYEFSTVQVQNNIGKMAAFNTGMSCSICFQDVVGCTMLDLLWLVTGYFQSVIVKEKFQ